MENDNNTQDKKFSETQFEHCKLYKGWIDGAEIAVAFPTKKEWNYCALLYAHGHRAASIPLQADLDPNEEGMYKKLIEEGWVVGMTSYRRGGIIIRDAIKDMHNLRNFIVCEFGIPFRVILEGRSMGGCISTHIAELLNSESLYHGVLAVGAALYAKEPVNPKPFTHNPFIPILYLTNSSEMGSIQQYIDECRKAEAPITPALWEISREGHNWVNHDERYNALMNLLQWIQFGTFITRRTWNNTVIKTGRASQIDYGNEETPEGGWGRITSTNVWGSIYTNFQDSDLRKLNIKIGSKFIVKFQSGKQFEVKYWTYPFMTEPEGAWLCAEDPEGFILFMINSFKGLNTIGKAEAKVGEPLYVEAVKFPSKKLAKKEQS